MVRLMIGLLNSLHGKTHVIWDWNGTLLNDVDMCVDIINALLQNHGLETLTREAYRRRFRFPVIEYYREIGFNFEKTPFTALAKDFMDQYEERILHCSLFEGVEGLLSTLHESKRTQSILSAAPEKQLKAFAERRGIAPYFTDICGLSDHYAQSKIDRGNEHIRSLSMPREEIVMIGDTDHDMEVAGALGIDVILLADGHQEFERLKAVHPNTIECRYKLSEVIGNV